MTTNTAAPAAHAAQPRQAALLLKRIDPWTMMKTAFVVSLGIGIAVLIATILLWGLLSAFGVFDSLTTALGDVTGSAGIDLGSLFSFGRVLGLGLVFAALEVIMLTVWATLMAYIYNLTVGMAGGVEMTYAQEG